MNTELLLVRHGQSEANAGCSTDPDCPLTDLGRSQARRLGERLAGCGLSDFLALTSPYRRARDTADAIARTTGLAFVDEPAVREWGASATVGGQSYPNEPIAEVVRRLEEFLRRYAGRKLLVVSHAAPIALLTQLAWGEEPTTAGEFWSGVSNCCF